MSPDLAHSVLTRLLQHAKNLGIDPNVVQTRFVTERLLYRLSRSAHAERFVLKGALLLLVWLGETIRPTRDADLLGFGELDAEALAATFAEICTLPVENDGVIFDTSSLRVLPIRPEAAYGGQRVTLLAHLGKARLKVQVDVGIGDAVIPEPVWLDYPSLLDLPAPRLRAYCPETAIAEKVHAMVVLDAKNSRMRDFFDVHVLASKLAFEGPRLAQALLATFERRGTPFPRELPIAFTRAFALEEGKNAQWVGFIRRLPSSSAPRSLETTVESIAALVGPVLQAVARGDELPRLWPPGGPWHPAGKG